MSAWPKNLPHTNIDYDTRQAILLNERLTQIEARIAQLELEKKKWKEARVISGPKETKPKTYLERMALAEDK